MGYNESTKILSLLDGTGISVADASKAVGGGGTDIGHVCQCKNINPYNKYKPIRFMSGGQEIFHPARLTENDYKNQHYGYTYPENDLTNALGFYKVCVNDDQSEFAQSWKPSEPFISMGGGWYYALPTKGFRLMDFIGPLDTSVGYSKELSKNLLDFTYGFTYEAGRSRMWMTIRNSSYSEHKITLADLGIGSDKTYSSFTCMGILIIPYGIAENEINNKARFFTATYSNTGGTNPQYYWRAVTGSDPDDNATILNAPDWHKFFAKKDSLNYYDSYYIIPFIGNTVSIAGAYSTNLDTEAKALFTGVPLPYAVTTIYRPSDGWTELSSGGHGSIGGGSGSDLTNPDI